MYVRRHVSGSAGTPRRTPVPHAVVRDTDGGLQYCMQLV